MEQMSFIEKLFDMIFQALFGRVNAPAKNGYTQERLFIPKTLTEKFRAMSPYDFEYLIKEFFETGGYKTIRAPQYKTCKNGKKLPLKDSGIDYIGERDGHRLFVQVKAYKSGKRQVTLSSMREFYAALLDIGRKPHDKALLITTTTFTKDAKKYAEERKISCIDYHYFKLLFEQLTEKNESNHHRLYTYIENVDYTQNHKFNKYMKTCPRCGAPLVKIPNKYHAGYFWGCQNYRITGCNYIIQPLYQKK